VPALQIWGKGDRLVPAVYAEEIPSRWPSRPVYRTAKPGIMAKGRGWGQRAGR